MAFLDPGTIRCKYFAAGNCNRDDCVFAHDWNALANSVCRYFLQGTCFFGDDCRYDHVDAEDLDRYHEWWTSENQAVMAQEKRPAQAATPRSSSAASRRSSSSMKPCAASTPKKAKKDDSPDGEKTPAEPSEPLSPAKPAKRTPLCRYGMEGSCPLIGCTLRHGALCEICLCQALDPEDEEQRKNHEKECTFWFERHMDYAFAVQQSGEKQCSVCLEVVLRQPDTTRRRFGILEKCNHTFCFDCIMNWRKQSREDLNDQAIRSCPECRTHSDYAVPTHVWPETPEHKQAIIEEFKTAMGKKPCRHFNQGEGKCPFGSQCWYMHARKDGTIVKLDPPRKRRRQASVLLDVAMDLFDIMDDDDYVDTTDDESDLMAGDIESDHGGGIHFDEDPELVLDLGSLEQDLDHEEYLRLFRGSQNATPGAGWPAGDGNGESSPSSSGAGNTSHSA